MELIVIRHGQPHNESIDEGTGDPALTEIGHEQAMSVARHLDGENITAIVSSPMQRAHESAKPLAQLLNLDIEIHDNLKEAGWNAGPYLRDEENKELFAQELAKNPDYFYLPEGREAFNTRIQNAFCDIAKRHHNKHTAVFCHGLVIGALINYTLNITVPDGKVDSGYTGITRIDTRDIADWKLLGYNELSHVR